MKDPAFLFYSKEFYEGTRTMYPDERACYIDLMIYQHQNGPIPDDINRLKLYCSGIGEATLQATLKAKFKHTDKGWINDKLQTVIDERQEYAMKQSTNGRIGQFWKKAKLLLDSSNYKLLKKKLAEKNNDELLEEIENTEINKAMLEAMLKGSLKHLQIQFTITDLSLFIPFEFVEIVFSWLEYKKSKRQSYKNEESVKVFFSHLNNLSGGDPEKAKRIVEQSIANNYSGIFELKHNGTHQRVTTRTEQVNREAAETLASINARL